MTILMTTLVQARVRTVRRWLMLCLSTLKEVGGSQVEE